MGRVFLTGILYRMDSALDLRMRPCIGLNQQTFPDVLSAEFDIFMWACLQHAVSTGAEAVAPPEAKEWGQKVGYVRDPDGVSIRLASELD